MVIYESGLIVWVILLMVNNESKDCDGQGPDRPLVGQENTSGAGRF